MPSTKTTKTSTNTATAATPHSPPPAPSPAEVASNVDLLTEILFRLPIKSLIKFKSVSKQWLSIISDPKFSLRRSSSPASATGLFLQNSEYADDNIPEHVFINLNNPSPHHSTPSFRSLTFAADRPYRIIILQSCNGLLLCCDTSSRYYVYNPTTNQHTTLPPLTPRAASDLVYGAALAFDPSRSPHYKVVCITNSTLDLTQFRIEIFSSDAGPQWRPSAHGPVAVAVGFDMYYGRGLFWNGGVHWINPWGLSLRFDVDGDRLHEMPVPPVPDALESIDQYFPCFAESRGHLHFVDYLIEPGESRINVYEMERDCSGWFVKYTVDISELLVAFPEMILSSDSDHEPSPDVYQFTVFCFVRGEIDEDSYLVVIIPGKILRYNFKKRTFWKLCDVPIEEFPEMGLESFYAYQYIESLACV